MDTERLRFLIGSPFCTPYSPLQALSAARRGPEEVRHELARADVHMGFVTEVYKEQVMAGRYFLHAHPLCATSGKLDCILDVVAMHGTTASGASSANTDRTLGRAIP